MPGVAFQSSQGDVGNDGTHAKCLAWKADVERRAYKAATAVSADQIAGVNDLFFCLCLRGNSRRYAVLVLFDANELASILHPMAELGETLAHDRLGQKLRNEQRRAIGFSRRG